MEICLAASPILETMLRDVKPDAGKTYRPSLYNRLCTGEKGTYLYNIMTRRLVRLTDREKKLLEEGTLSGSVEAAAPLITKRFLVEMEADELTHYVQLHGTQELFSGNNGLELYRILPTTGCNARCFYCFEQGVQVLNMKEDTADAVIDYIKKTGNPNKKLRLEWFGGEPLLRMGIMDRICAGLSAADIEFVSTMTTNGSLLTPQLIQKAQKEWKLDKVQITLDGAKAAHEQRKAYVSLPDAYELTLANIASLVAAGVGVTVRMNMDLENAQSIHDLYDHLRAQYRATDRIAIEVAMLFGAQDDPRLQESWFALRQKMWQDGFLKVKKLSDSLPRWHCFADAPLAVTILPDGTLTTCEAGCEEMYYGDIRQGVTKPEVRNAWRATNAVREKCRTCPYLPECTSFSRCRYEAADCRKLMADTFAYQLAVTVRKFEAM